MAHRPYERPAFNRPPVPARAAPVLTGGYHRRTINPTMSDSRSYRVRAVAEVLAPYGRDEPPGSHTKVSISLPSDLVQEVRAVAARAGMSFSGAVAASLRRTLDDADQARLDAAIEAQNEENLALANAYLPVAAKVWSEIEW